MNRIRDGSETGTCAKGTLTGIIVTGCLLMAVALASVLLVEVPLPARAGDGASAAPYVPASKDWIELGASERAGALGEPGSFGP